MTRQSSRTFFCFGFIFLFALASPLWAVTAADQDYLNKLTYHHDQLQLTVKTRLINEQRGYSSTNINTSAYSYEAYSQTLGNISTSSLSQAEVKEITDWFVYRGGVRELSDLEFLELVGERNQLEKIEAQENQKANLRLVGNTAIGLGLMVMIGGAGLSASSQTIMYGALTTVVGFFVTAFNLSPHHYIQADFAQQKVDEYNISLKKKLNLPIDYK